VKIRKKRNGKCKTEKTSDASTITSTTKGPGVGARMVLTCNFFPYGIYIPVNTP